MSNPFGYIRKVVEDRNQEAARKQREDESRLIQIKANRKVVIDQMGLFVMPILQQLKEALYAGQCYIFTGETQGPARTDNFEWQIIEPGTEMVSGHTYAAVVLMFHLDTDRFAGVRCVREKNWVDAKMTPESVIAGLKKLYPVGSF